MISLEHYRASIGGWGGRGRSPLSQCPFRKSPFSVFIDILWRISTRLRATTISALLMIGGVELNPGPGSTTEEVISPIDIEDCSQDAFVLSSQTLQRTPISSQVVPLTDLDLLSQCSSDTPMTPEKIFSTPKSRKRKGNRARNDRNRAAIKKRRSDDTEFCKAENQSRLERFNEDCEDSDFLAKHNENHLRDITKRLKDPAKRAEHNKQQLKAMTERLKDPAKRAVHNKLQLKAMTERLKDPAKRAVHNKQQLKAMNERLKDAEKRAEHNKQQLKAMNERLNDPEKRADHNKQQLKAMNERLNDPEKRADHNKQQLKAMNERLNDPEMRAEHNKHVLERYRTNREEVSSVIRSYFSQISRGPTYVCSCCGCLHFRKAVILKREKLVSTNVSNSDFVKQVIIIFNIAIYYNYPLNRNSLEILYIKTLGFKINYSHLTCQKAKIFNQLNSRVFPVWISS